jgi:hypothetical protein
MLYVHTDTTMRPVDHMICVGFFFGPAIAIYVAVALGAASEVVLLAALATKLGIGYLNEAIPPPRSR